MELSYHPSAAVREAAIRALWNDRSPAWIERLTELAKDPNRTVQFTADHILKQIEQTLKVEEEKENRTPE